MGRKKKSRDYGNWDIPFKDLAMPRNKEELLAYRIRYDEYYDIPDESMLLDDIIEFAESEEECRILKKDVLEFETSMMPVSDLNPITRRAMRLAGVNVYDKPLKIKIK